MFTNMQRVKALHALYEGALFVVGTSIATTGHKLREYVIDSDAIGLLKKSLQRITSMYSRFIYHLNEEEHASAESQCEYMVASLEDILKRIDGYKSMLGSHRNDSTITRNDFAMLVRLEHTAKEQIAGVVDYLEDIQD